MFRLNLRGVAKKLIGKSFLDVEMSDDFVLTVVDGKIRKITYQTARMKKDFDKLEFYFRYDMYEKELKPDWAYCFEYGSLKGTCGFSFKRLN